jgi:hypothetical protein
VGVREQLTEPWGIVAAGLLGGLGAAVTAALAPAGLVIGVPVGLAIAGAVYGVRVGVGAFTDRGPRTKALPDSGRLPVPVRGSPADKWLRRARAAVDTLRRQTQGTPDAPLRERIGEVDDRAEAVLGDLVRFAGQVTLVEQAAGRINEQRLRQEHGQLQRGLERIAAGPLKDEQQRALGAVADQLAVARRLNDAREMLLARMQSAVLSLEGLVARMAELLAMHATTEGITSLTDDRLAELTNDLEGMRAGLAEAEKLSRTALSGGTGASTI